MFKIALIAFTLIAVALPVCIQPAGATVWDASVGFPTNGDNPSGVWSYGWKPDPGGVFDTFKKANVTTAGLYQYHSPTATYDITYGWICWNPSSDPIPCCNYYAAYGVDMHPGRDGQATTIRWTAPEAAWVRASVSFAIYSGGGAPGGYLAVNGETIYNLQMLGNGVPGDIRYGGDPQFVPFGSHTSNLLHVSANDTIDCSIDRGPDHYWGGDATGITFVVQTTVPGGYISGNVKSSLPGSTGLPGATVTTTPGNYSTVTDGSGHYTIMLESGTYSVKFSAPDCTTQQIDNVVVTGDSTTPLDVTLVTTKLSWNAAADYSGSANPNGLWSYGYKPLEPWDGAFTLYTATSDVGGFGLYQWSLPDTNYGWISYNSNPDPLLVPWNVWWYANGIDMHPGADGQRTTIRWTSPMASWVDISATYMGMNTVAPYTTSGGDVVINGVQVWGAFVNGYMGDPSDGNAGQAGDTPFISESLTHHVNVGDTIDFCVGWGQDEYWGGDPTAVDFTVALSTNPPPPTAVDRLADLQDGVYVSVAGKAAICNGTTFTDAFFIEEPDRSSGMKVIGGSGKESVVAGDSVTVVGFVATDPSGKLYIDAESVSRAAGTLPGAVGTSNRSLSSIKGLLTKVWGGVTDIDSSTTKTFFYVDDGSGLLDGSGSVGVRVDCSKLSTGLSPVIAALTPGQFVKVTGVVVTEDGKPVIRARSGADIQ